MININQNNELDNLYNGDSIYLMNYAKIKIMDIKQIRIENLKTLITEAGSSKELANRMGWKDSFVSERKRGVRGMSSSTLRLLEKEFKKGSGWMDKHHSDNPDNVKDALKLIQSQSSEAISDAIELAIQVMDNYDRDLLLKTSGFYEGGIAVIKAQRGKSLKLQQDGSNLKHLLDAE